MNRAVGCELVVGCLLITRRGGCLLLGLLLDQFDFLVCQFIKPKDSLVDCSINGVDLALKVLDFR